MMTRQNLKTHLCLFFMAMVMSLTMVIPAFAEADTDQRIFDGADLFTDTEEAQLQAEVDAIQTQHKIDVVLLTVDEMRTPSGALTEDIELYAHDFYDDHGFGVGSEGDGFLLMVDMGSRQVAVSTKGKVIRIFTDARIESILDSGYRYLPDGAYAQAFFAMLDTSEGFLERGIPQNQHNYDTETGEVSRYRSITLLEGFFALCMAILAGRLFYVGAAKDYRPQTASESYDFKSHAKLDLTHRNDRYLNAFVSTRRIPRSSSSRSSSSGRSSTRRSSSGGTHGGGSRKF